MLEDAGVIVTDRENRVRYSNPEAARLLNLTLDQLTGLECTELGFPFPDPAKSNAGPIREPLVLRRGGREIARVRHRSQNLLGRNGEFAGRVHLIREEFRTARPSESARPIGNYRNAASFHGLVSRDRVMLQQFDLIERLAGTDTTVLVRGESGTGKELVARAIHRLSHRKDGPFLAVNCAALSPTLLESQLFGHVRGAFTGAVRDHAGLFEQAKGGTVFLDEVAELPFDLQAKLLRVLQERTFVPLGGTRTIAVDARIISATHRSLREEVKASRFREDLMFRLRVVPLFLPALRERREDIPLLLWNFIEKQNELGTRHIERISPEAMRALLDHPWPGNVRELQNVVEYASVVGRGPELSLAELPPEFREHRAAQTAPSGLRRSSRNLTREQILGAIDAAGGRMDEAAKQLGLSKATFWRRRKHFGID
jgi:two-component system, NtrC family, response regulator AtoC